MLSLNQVMCAGNIGNDLEMRYTQSGTAVLSLNLAMNEGKKKPDGTWENYTEWITVVCWGELAERVNEYGAKGRNVFVQGKIKTRQWEGNDGRKNRKTEIVAFSVKFIDKRTEKKTDEFNEDDL